MKILPINNARINRIDYSGSRKQNFLLLTPPTACDSVNFKSANKASVQKIIILLGAPNSGKGTCAKKIAQKYSIPQISLGDIFRNEIKLGTELGFKVKSYMENGELVPDGLIMDALTKRIAMEDCKNGFILDGFPRTLNQAEKFGGTIKGLNNAELKIINLDVDKEILYARSANRYICPECSKIYSLEKFDPETSKCECGAKLVKRSDDTPEVLTKRLENYEKQTLPLINYYSEKVSNVSVHGVDIPPEETFLRVIENIEK